MFPSGTEGCQLHFFLASKGLNYRCPQWLQHLLQLEVVDKYL